MTLREWRVARGLTQDDVAAELRKLGVVTDKTAVSTYERRRVVPGTKRLAAIEALTGGEVRAADFFGPAATDRGLGAGAARRALGLDPKPWRRDPETGEVRNTRRQALEAVTDPTLAPVSEPR